MARGSIHHMRKSQAKYTRKQAKRQERAQWRWRVQASSNDTDTSSASSSASSQNTSTTTGTVVDDEVDSENEVTVVKRDTETT